MNFNWKILLIPLLFFFLTTIYLFPLFQGLILLPLDLLISNYGPWYQPGTILLKNPYMQDSVIQLFPWRHLVFQSLTSGIIPLWNPYQHLGSPFMANLKPMVFYPLNLLFIFGEVKAWNYLLFSQIFLAMLFAYYLARDFRLKLLPSIFIAIGFAFNSYMIGLLEFGSDAHTIIWWPLLILFAKRYIEQQKGKYLFLLGLTLSFSVFAGQLQYLTYFLFFLLAFIIYYGRSLHTKLSVYIFLFLSVSLGMGISAVQILPSIELFGHSHRALLSESQTHETFKKGLVTPDVHLRLFSPDIFGNPVSKDATSGYIETSGYFGIVPLFFALFAIIFARRNSVVKFLTVSFIAAILFSLQGIGEILYLLKIPIIASAQGDRIFTVVLLSGVFLAGFGLTEFIEMKNKKKKLISILTFFSIYILIMTIYISIHKTNGSVSAFLQNIKFSSFFLFAFFLSSLIYIYVVSWKKYERILKMLFLLFIVGLTFLDLFRFGYRFLTFSNNKFLYPDMGVTKFIQDASKKDLSRTYGLTEPELGTYLNVYTVETYNPLYLMGTGKLLQSLQNKSMDDLSTDNKYFLTSDGDNLKRTIDLVGVKYIVSAVFENPSTKYFNTNSIEKDLQKVYSDERYSVYENLKSYPRFGLYYNNTVIKNDNDALNAIAKGEINLQKNLILQENLHTNLTEGTGSAKLLSSNVNSQKFEVMTDKPALFYVSDTFYPGWQAKVNNEPTKIYKANYNFRAILVPQGRSIVEFAYLPMSFLIGIWVSLGSLLLLICIAIIPLKKIHKS